MRDSAAAAQSRLFWRVALGCIWIFLGGYVVPKAAYVLSPDGEIQSFYIKTAIFLAAAGCLLMGLLSFSQRVLRNNFFQKINLCFFSLIILTPFCAELFFRTGIALNHPFFKNPALYADFYTDDNFWKLQWTSPGNLDG